MRPKPSNFETEFNLSYKPGPLASRKTEVNFYKTAVSNRSFENEFQRKSTAVRMLNPIKSSTSQCKMCINKEEYISTLQQEIQRLQNLANDLTYQLVMHNIKPKAQLPQKVDNRKKCFLCNSDLTVLPVNNQKEIQPKISNFAHPADSPPIDHSEHKKSRVNTPLSHRVLEKQRRPGPQESPGMLKKIGLIKNNKRIILPPMKREEHK